MHETQGKSAAPLARIFGSTSFEPWSIQRALLAAPFLLDTVANTAGFYERFNATDDVLHLLNWILLVGALAIIWWEAFEWLLSTDGPLTGNLELGYTDTVGDLVLSSSGGLLGSFLTIALLGPPRQNAVSPAPA